jgi:hypothetical protein
VSLCKADAGHTGIVAIDASVPEAIAESTEARERVADLRARFGSVIASRAASRFDLSDTSHVRAVIPAAAKRGVVRAATVDLPVVASCDTLLEDDATKVAVKFHLHGARDAKLEVADGVALYRGALAGNDVVHRAHAEGTEDFVVFETRPDVQELAYDVDVARVAGLRLVGNVIEFLDEGGTPRLRVGGSSCNSVSDCAPPNVCDPMNHCVAPTSAPSGDSGGCAMGARRDASNGGGAWLAATLAALAIVSRGCRTRSRRARGR